MADVEAWLASLEPVVIDRWLAFAAVEPEAFASGGASDVRGANRARGRLLDATEASRKLAARCH